MIHPGVSNEQKLLRENIKQTPKQSKNKNTFRLGTVPHVSSSSTKPQQKPSGLYLSKNSETITTPLQKPSGLYPKPRTVIPEESKQGVEGNVTSGIYPAKTTTFPMKKFDNLVDPIPSMDSNGNWATIVKGKKVVSPEYSSGIYAVEKPHKEGNYILIKAILDSGAVDHVQPPEVAAMFPIEETFSSRAGHHFCSANGGMIPNLGKRTLVGLTDNYDSLDISLQIGKGLEKTLLSVRKLTESGCKVVLDGENGDFILFKATNKFIPVYQEEGLYKVNLWIDIGNTSNDMNSGTGKIYYYDQQDVASEDLVETITEECKPCLQENDDSIFLRRR